MPKMLNFAIYPLVQRGGADYDIYLLACLFVVYLTTLSASQNTKRQKIGRLVNNELENAFERSSCGLNQGTASAFSWANRGKVRKTSDRIPGPLAEI
jgi:hypothetical protein